MNCLVWNVQGLGNQRAFWNLHRILTNEDPTLVFLCETKVTATQCLNLRSKLGFEGSDIQDCIGRKGGLILLWKSPMMVEIKSSSSSHIDVIITHVHRSWRFTSFYGNQVVEQRKFSWQILE